MRSIVAKLTILLLLTPGIVFAQGKLESATPADTSPRRTLIISGRVSDDGKSLMTDLDSEWAVSNSSALKGHEGRLVRVKCYVDAEKNRIQIVSVRKIPDESNYAARTMDSAFRR